MLVRMIAVAVIVYQKLTYDAVHGENITKKNTAASATDHRILFFTTDYTDIMDLFFHRLSPNYSPPYREGQGGGSLYNKRECKEKAEHHL